MICTSGWSEGNASIGGNYSRELLYPKRNGGVVVIRFCIRLHGAADVAHLRVVENAFKAVANFNPAEAWIHHQEHEHTAVAALRAYLPLVLQLGCKLLNRLIAIDRFDGDNGNFRVRLASDGGTESFDLLPHRVREDTGKVVHIPLRRRQTGDSLCWSVKCKKEQNERTKKPAAHRRLPLHVLSRLSIGYLDPSLLLKGARTLPSC